MRPLGIPTIADRVAQTVVKMVLEPLVEPVFHPDSYGYRPDRSALDAVGVARNRCWEFDWVIDLDLKAFFDSIPHDLIERAVAHHTDLAWVRLYVGRWLRAPGERLDGTREERTRGTPQGGVASPLLANLFLHYAFDCWMQRSYPQVPKSSTARTTTEGETTSESSSTFSVIPFNLGGPGIGGDTTSSASCRP